MKLAISNIAWAPEADSAVYALMARYGYTGLEIAPTRVFPEAPYDRAEEARLWSRQLRASYGFSVPSMQSIWYGRRERLFGSEQERSALREYTKKAVDFAAAIGCGNLVFGCPRNRCVPEGADPRTAVGFFRELGGYAAARGTAIGLETNPPIYHTNYVNTTASALALIREVGSAGFCLNLDVGAMVENREDPSLLEGEVELINHVHLSEPGLRPLEQRDLHRRLARALLSGGYRGFVSVEMGPTADVSIIERTLEYAAEIFHPEISKNGFSTP